MASGGASGNVRPPAAGTSSTSGINRASTFVRRKGISAPAPDFRYRVADQMAVQRSVVLDRGGDAEGLGHNGLEFQDIGDVVNKACG
jgi:hypothetical protein